MESLSRGSSGLLVSVWMVLAGSPCEPPLSLFWEDSKCTRKAAPHPWGARLWGSLPWRLLWAPALSALLENGTEFTQQSFPFSLPLWDLILVVAVLVQGATGAEQDNSLPKTGGINEPFLRVRFSAQEPAEQTYHPRLVTERWHWVLRATALAQPLIHPGPAGALREHCTAQQPTSYLDFCHRCVGSENLGEKTATWEIFLRIIKFY